MEVFNKVCMGFAFALGAVLALLGVTGVFFGSSASFKLPPIVGVLPAFAGWGIIFAVRNSWGVAPRSSASNANGDLGPPAE